MKTKILKILDTIWYIFINYLKLLCLNFAILFVIIAICAIINFIFF